MKIPPLAIAAASALIVCATACDSAGGTAVPGTAVSLRPYATSTSRPAAGPSEDGAGVTLPTSTPFTYTVVANDTLIGIATHFGVRLEDLMAANPGVSPTGLTVGMTLKIPTGPQDVLAGAPTPVPLNPAPPECFPTPDGGMWCFLPVSNPYPDVLENLTAQITLSDEGGKTIAAQVATGALDILPPGKVMPLTTFFTPPVPAGARASAEVTTAIRLPAGDTRYIPASARGTVVAVDWSGRFAQVRGQVAFAQGGTAGRVWVLGVAYDESGRTVGFRRWEPPPGTPLPDGLPFAFSLASLGGGIDRVEVLVEARP